MTFCLKLMPLRGGAVTVSSLARKLAKFNDSIRRSLSTSPASFLSTSITTASKVSSSSPAPWKYRNSAELYVRSTLYAQRICRIQSMNGGSSDGSRSPNSMLSSNLIMIYIHKVQRAKSHSSEINSDHSIGSVTSNAIAMLDEACSCMAGCVFRNQLKAVSREAILAVVKALESRPSNIVIAFCRTSFCPNRYAIALR